MENELNKYIGKVVATRGYVSGVNVGRLLSINTEKNYIVLTESFFLNTWNYKDSYGSMASLSGGDIVEGGEITKVHDDCIITDAGQIVICPEKVLDVCKKCAK